MNDIATLLDRAPKILRRFAYRVAAGQGVVGRLADALRFRFSEEDVPEVPPPSDDAVRLFIGPANSAGQGFQWARAVERHLSGVSAVSMHGIGPDPFQPVVDLRVPVAVYQRSSSWHTTFEEYLGQRTHVVWESGFPLLGRRYGSNVANEMKQLEWRGVRGALLFHGSDIRPPSRHAALNRWSPFRDPSGPTRALEDGARRNAELVAKTRVPVFVSTPDLAQWIPEAAWCPVVIDPEKWYRAESATRHSGPPVVVHAPSQRWLKGTNHIEPMLRRLAEERVIEYRQVVGVPHASMPAFYAEADIVLDQFALGSYGVAACEAMASGRVVIGHVDEATRTEVQDRTGFTLPIEEATIETLESTLRHAAADLGAYESLRAAGPAFVKAVHDGRFSAGALASFLGVTA